MPAFDGCDDFVRVGGPCEGLWHLICLCEEAVDSGLEIDDGSEDATFQAPLGQLGEVTLHGVEPGARSRREVEDEAHVPSEPTLHLGMLMGPSCRSASVSSLPPVPRHWCAASDAGGSFGLLASECRTGAGGTVARDQPDSNIEGEI
jgi:hypothetical protein